MWHEFMCLQNNSGHKLSRVHLHCYYVKICVEQWKKVDFKLLLATWFVMLRCRYKLPQGIQILNLKTTLEGYHGEENREQKAELMIAWWAVTIAVDASPRHLPTFLRPTSKHSFSFFFLLSSSKSKSHKI